jgi:hypothetical protein
MVPVFERAKTFHAFDRAATVIGLSSDFYINPSKIWQSSKYFGAKVTNRNYIHEEVTE